VVSSVYFGSIETSKLSVFGTEAKQHKQSVSKQTEKNRQKLKKTRKSQNFL
jgi:hypothetical protein